MDVVQGQEPGEAAGARAAPSSAPRAHHRPAVVRDGPKGRGQQPAQGALRGAAHPGAGLAAAPRPRPTRTLFLGRAPHHAQQRVRGIEDVRVRLGVAQPGESVAVFNDALARLSDRLTYLYSGNHRYWYDTHPNLRRTAEDRASRLEGQEARGETEARLRREREKGDFRAVSWWADPSGSDVADEQAVRLVVLQSGHRYRRTRTDTEALAVTSRILEQRGNSPRRFRNMLVFVAPDAEAMEGLDLEVRRYLAWKSIVDEQDILNLDAHQRRQAQDSMKRSNDTVDLRLREAYSWLLVPAQEAGGAWQWEATRILGDGSIPHRASRKLRDSEQLITRWSPALLRMELDRWLWKDVPHLGVKKLWEYLCTYGYLPRLQDQEVLLEDIAEEIVQHLVALRGAHVEVMLDIAAHIPEGPPDHVVRTVTENARTLKFI